MLTWSKVALAERATAHAALDNPHAVAGLLKELREAGAHEQTTALAERAAAHAALDNPHAVAGLLKVLREAGAHEQVAVLTERPAAGHFDRFLKLGGNRERFRLGREPNGSAARSWTWNDMD